MKLPQISNGQAQIIIGLAGFGVAVIALYYTKKSVTAVTDGVKTAAQAVNPVNNDNIINKGVNAVFGLDNKTESIGTKIYDWVNEPKKQQTTPSKKADSKTTPSQAAKLVAPFMSSKDFRFYELKPTVKK